MAVNPANKSPANVKDGGNRPNIGTPQQQNVPAPGSGHQGSTVDPFAGTPTATPANGGSSW